MSHNKTELSGHKIPEDTKFSATKVLSNSVDSLGFSQIQRHIFYALTKQFQNVVQNVAQSKLPWNHGNI
jgi:hypothetical protein